MKHIVMLDDDDQLLDSVRGELERAGYRFSSTLPGAAGAESEPAGVPDLVVVDLVASRSWDPVQRLQRDPELRAVPLILLSGVRKMLDLPLPAAGNDRPPPVRAFVEKPFEPSSLRQKIDEILGQQE